MNNLIAIIGGAFTASAFAIATLGILLLHKWFRHLETNEHEDTED